MHITLIKQRIPEQGERDYLLGWILRSIGISQKEQGPVTKMLLEIAKRRKDKKGISGKELLLISGLGKTQTYYWLKRLEEIGLIGKGKKQGIEYGAEYTLKGYFLSGANIKEAVRNMQKKTAEIIDNAEKVAERLDAVIEREKIPAVKETIETKPVETPKIETPASDQKSQPQQ